MKVFSVIGLLFAAAILATIPISPQVTPRGLVLSVDQAQAITYGRHRRVHRRAYRRAYRSAYYWGAPPIITVLPRTITALALTTTVPPTMLPATSGVGIGGELAEALRDRAEEND